ncbi:hypothetical protein MR857_14665 [bacterium]|jgi:DNA-binding NarL/FixJ family response regulator|uniref:hypothetical protein n=1 Tax=Agathobacter rectalis TaxID=39491 RepID=UPI0027D318B3|nr:hypothetical protein [Agathobacter rectalis]MCB6950204.1 hypothetical protein [Agathobacter rectalis]MCI6044531.1 hypothetical protein [bacterium]MDY3022521.1 hypothetical protein [Oliverpabstia sp.]MDY3999573.1 hypothetical protein [Blautia sp.]
MTIEEQRYLDECKKVLNREQLDAVTMAMDYGLQIQEIRKVVQSNQSAPCMHEIVLGMMEGIKTDVLDFLCENDFNQYQIKEIREGIAGGLTFEQVKSYATKEMSANRMKKMRQQLENTMQEKNGQPDDSVREYMKGLMEIMETSIQQFRESNERFDALSSLVKEHVVDEKNREIQELYENLKYKDKSIQELQRKLADRDKTIADLKSAIAEGRRETEPQKVPEERIPEKVPTVPDGETKRGELLFEPVMKEPQAEKKRMLGWFLRDKKVPQDVFGKIMEADLSTEQLEEVRQCIECGLTDREIARVIENTPAPERMRKMREILMLMKKRKGGA